jgi:hypothetical protein
MCSASQPSSRAITTRCAARSTSCPAARCRRSPSRTTRSRGSRGSGRCTCCRCRATDVGLAGGERRADRVHARDELARLAEHVEHLRAHARHDAHVDDDVRRVGDLDADVAMGEPSGPMLNGTTYIVRPRMQPSKALRSVAFISRGGPVVGGAGVVLVGAADEGALLDARDVATGRERARKLLGRFSGFSRMNRAAPFDHPAPR